MFLLVSPIPPYSPLNRPEDDSWLATVVLYFDSRDCIVHGVILMSLICAAIALDV